MHRRLVLLLLAACGEVHDDGTFTPPPTCGDGALDPGELCDDGNTDDRDGCSAACIVESCLVPVTHASVQAGLDDAACPTVRLAPGTYLENVTIARDVTLVGVGAEPAILDGQARGSVVAVGAAVVTIQKVTIRNGRAVTGGGIANLGTLTLRDSLVESNTATRHGGGVYSKSPTLVVLASTVRGNHLVYDGLSLSGAGVYVSGQLDATDSTFEGNDIVHAGPGRLLGYGAGIFGGDVRLTRSTVTANRIDLESTTSDAVASGAGVYSFAGKLTSIGSRITSNAVVAKGRPTSAAGGGVSVNELFASETEIDRNTLQVTADPAIATYETGGAGVVLRGDALLQDSRVTNNELTFGGQVGMTGDGGGIASWGENLTLIRAKISGNKIVALGPELFATGGGVWWGPYSNAGTRQLRIEQTVLSSNVIEAESAGGGGLAVRSELGGSRVRILQSTISGNRLSGTAGRGGGIVLETWDNQTTAAIVSSTISGNTLSFTGGSAEGAGLFAGTPATSRLRVQILSSTITANESMGVGTAGTAFAGLVETKLRNTILSGNGTLSDCSNDGATLTTSGGNLFGRITGCTFTGAGTDKSSTAPNLGALADNGGPTPTHQPLGGSPVIDAGTTCIDDTDATLTQDQRGLPRVSGARCDIGSVER